MLRNRRTGEKFSINHLGRAKKIGFFKKEPLSKEILFFLNHIQERFPKDLTEGEKEEKLQILRNLCEKHQKEINELCSAPQQLKDLFNSFERVVNKKYKEKSITLLPPKTPTLPDLIKNIVNMMVMMKFPAASFIGALPIVAAEVDQYGIYEGIPKGGKDLCTGFLLNCVQGYITFGDASWTVDNSQFNRIILDSGEAYDTAAYEVLNQCITREKVDEMVVNALENGKNVNKTVAPLSSNNMWHGLTISGQASAIPDEMEASLQKEFTLANQNYMSESARFDNEAMKLGIVLGSVLAIAICVGACWYAKEKYQEYQHRSIGYRV